MPDLIESIALGMNASGQAVAVTKIVTATEYIVTARRSMPGNGWSEPARLDSAQLAEVEEMRVAVDAAGNAIVVWNEEVGAVYETWSSRYSASGGWSAAERIGSADQVYGLDLAIDVTGNAIAVWQTAAATANTTNIMANRYGNAAAVWIEFDPAGVGSIHTIRFE